MQQPELSKKLYKLIKSENHAIQAYETAGRESLGVASQLSEWGEDTGDDAISDISDKLGVILAEIAEQEDTFASGLEDSRSVLKQIRNTEQSVQPSRDQKTKISDELQKLKYKEPTSTKIAQLEQELVRAEAQSLVAEAQLTNITRKKFREAYAIRLAAVVERAEKQAILAHQAQKLLHLLDDSPIVPGEGHEPFTKSEEARLILSDAENELKAWKPSFEIPQQTATGPDGMAVPQRSATTASTADESDLYSDPRSEGSVTDTTAAEAPTSTYQEGIPVQGHTG